MTSAFDPNQTIDTAQPVDLIQQLCDLRQKVLDGEEITSEEFRIVMDNLRSHRTAAPVTKAKAAKATKATKPAVEPSAASAAADELFSF